MYRCHDGKTADSAKCSRPNRQELLKALDAAIENLNRPQRRSGQVRRGDRRYRRRCAECKRFLPGDRRSSYCAFHQSQRMIARRSEEKIAKREAELRAIYEAADPAERERFEGWLYWSAVKDPSRWGAMMAHREKYGVTSNPLDYLMGPARGSSSKLLLK